MANKPFEYRIINPLERPKSEDLNIAQGQAHYDVRELAYELFARNNGFLGYSFNPEPLTPLDGLKISIQQGVAFQFGASEYNIGGINGLNDVFTQKAVTAATRVIDLATHAPSPTGPNNKRYDLIQIRALQGTERLITQDQVATDILNPSDQTFTNTSKFKTLASSLSYKEVVFRNVGSTITDPYSYVIGAVTAASDWNDVVQPPVSVGYLGVAYIKRYTGQTDITAADIIDARTLLTLPPMAGGTGLTETPAGEILLGNGSSPITSTAILPVSKGGTGNGNPSAFMGSVAYYDDSTDQLKYSQAIKTFVPRTGWLLASNSTGAPTWIEPGSVGQVLVSTGTTWEAGTSYIAYSAQQTTQYTRYTTTYSEITELALVDKYFNEGIVRVRIQPKDTGVESVDPMIFVYNANTSNGSAGYLKFEVTGSAFSKTFIFSASVGIEESDQMALPAFDLPVNTGTYTIRVYGKVRNPDSDPPDRTTLYVQNCTLFVSQG